VTDVRDFVRDDHTMLALRWEQGTHNAILEPQVVASSWPEGTLARVDCDDPRNEAPQSALWLSAHRFANRMRYVSKSTRTYCAGFRPRSSDHAFYNSLDLRRKVDRFATYYNLASYCLTSLCV
jgi:hypothetical protein